MSMASSLTVTSGRQNIFWRQFGRPRLPNHVDQLVAFLAPPAHAAQTGLDEADRSRLQACPKLSGFVFSSRVGLIWLGGLDSNQDSQIQSLESYQLDDLPPGGNKNESRQVPEDRDSHDSLI